MGESKISKELGNVWVSTTLVLKIGYCHLVRKSNRRQVVYKLQTDVHKPNAALK